MPTAAACNCTGKCRPPSQGGVGRCPALGPAIAAPVCNLCGAAWINGHTCDRAASCPCRPESGGSGVCGCILGGLKVTC